MYIFLFIIHLTDIAICPSSSTIYIFKNHHYIPNCIYFSETFQLVRGFLPEVVENNQWISIFNLVFLIYLTHLVILFILCLVSSMGLVFFISAKSAIPGYTELSTIEFPPPWIPQLVDLFSIQRYRHSVDTLNSSTTI